MGTLTNPTTPTQYQITFRAKDGKKDQRWLSRNEFNLNKEYKPLGVKENDTIEKIKIIERGKVNVVEAEICDALYLLNLFQDNLEIPHDGETWEMTDNDDTEVFKYSILLDTIIKRIQTAKNEFEKQVDYLEVTNRS